LKLFYPLLILFLALASCKDTSFVGTNVQRPERLAGDFLDPDSTQPKGPGGGGGEQDLPDEGVTNIVDGELELQHMPLNTKIMRRDKGSGDHGHDNVSVSFRVEGREDVKGSSLQKKGQSMELKGVCVVGGETMLEIGFSYGGAKVVPSKNTGAGGPIGHRLNDHAILVGFEKEGVNNGSETAYHNNDDLVVLFACPSGTKLSIKDLCIDTRIPGTTPANSDLVTDDITYSGDELGRSCDGK
jgi:hypothetical protein